jgi:hypothetical protein
MISSLSEILNHDELSSEEKVEFAFRFFADEVFKTITEIPLILSVCI